MVRCKSDQKLIDMCWIFLRHHPNFGEVGFLRHYCNVGRENEGQNPNICPPPLPLAAARLKVKSGDIHTLHALCAAPFCSENIVLCCIVRRVRRGNRGIVYNMQCMVHSIKCTVHNGPYCTEHDAQ